MTLSHVFFWIAGAVTTLTFMRTAYVHVGISRWFYLGDLAIGLMWIAIAYYVAKVEVQ